MFVFSVNDMRLDSFLTLTFNSWFRLIALLPKRITQRKAINNRLKYVKNTRIIKLGTTLAGLLGPYKIIIITNVESYH